ncbi:hypothetical protein BDV98DRAFT_572220 [Pterulicium gracile]|uniref:Uncharacterized protein n=1 Tax=Pterulicium gracile TaxID=1884261 RepID=A0A5C3Q9W1_9AGAR|nr:hypothetical protein BDV98DRAFT_572220 [Pterula gracilis]
MLNLSRRPTAHFPRTSGLWETPSTVWRTSSRMLPKASDARAWRVYYAREAEYGGY